MIVTVAVAAYAVGAVIFARMLAGHLAWQWKSQYDERPAALDWLTGWTVGLLGCWLWLPALAVRGLSHVSMPAIGAEREARQQQHERQLAAARERIAQLERDVGLEPSPGPEPPAGTQPPPATEPPPGGETQGPRG